MAIPYNKTRMIVTLTDRIKSDFEYLCEIDKRNPSKELEHIIESFLVQYYKNEYIKVELDEYFEKKYKPKQIGDEILSIWERMFGYKKMNWGTIKQFEVNDYRDTYVEKLSKFKSLLKNENMLKQDFITYNKDNIIFDYLEDVFTKHEIFPQLMSDTFNIIIETFYEN